MRQRTFQDMFEATVTIGEMIRGEQVVRSAVTELIREQHEDIRINPEVVNGFEWDYDLCVPAVGACWVSGLQVNFTVSSEDLVWTGDVPAITVLERMGDILTASVALLDEKRDASE